MILTGLRQQDINSNEGKYIDKWVITQHDTGAILKFIIQIEGREK